MSAYFNKKIPITNGYIQKAYFVLCFKMYEISGIAFYNPLNV